MWNEINNSNDICNFMNKICWFHDSCIKEIKYISGAYVNEELSMYPVNSQRTLRMIIQRQFDDISMLEMEFQEIKYLKLFPSDSNYTCEILDATLILEDGYIYWCDMGDLSLEDIKDYDGTSICAKKLRWRVIDAKYIGKNEFYLSTT